MTLTLTWLIWIVIVLVLGQAYRQGAQLDDIECQVKANAGYEVEEPCYPEDKSRANGEETSTDDLGVNHEKR